MDETWVHHYDPETKIQSMQWKHKGSPTLKKFKVLPSAGKVLLSVFWDAQEGVIMVDYLQRGARITSLYYADLIHKLRDAIKEKHRGKLRQKVPSSSRQCPKPQVLSCNGCNFNSRLWIAGPSTVSPDLAPSNYRLFPKLKEHLRGKKFSSNNEVMQWFAEVGQPFFQEAVEMLKHRWEKCVNLLEDYVEKWGKKNIFSHNSKWV